MSIGNYAWILKSKGDESAFGGNEGYDDVAGTTYIYDTTVKNHDKISEGDIIIVAGKKYIEGFGRIDKIEVKPNMSKLRFRCPVCNTQEHYQRKNVSPKFKCRNKHEFDDLIQEEVIVNQFSATYKENYIPCSPKSSVSLLNDYYVKRNFYYSIQPVRIDFFRREFPLVLDKLISEGVVIEFETEAIDQSFLEIPEYLPSDVDARISLIARKISREGQQRFREALIKYYGVKCMITGCGIPQAIEAGHVNPYRGKKDNHPANGLLLRRDLHALFDCNIIGIHPDDLRVHIHPSLKNSEYSSLDDKAILLPRNGLAPSREALEIRWKLFLSGIEEFKN